MLIHATGILLLLNIWASKRSGASIDAAKDLEYVRICMDWIKASEKRYDLLVNLFLLTGLTVA